MYLAFIIKYYNANSTKLKISHVAMDSNHFMEISCCASVLTHLKAMAYKVLYMAIVICTVCYVGKAEWFSSMEQITDLLRHENTMLPALQRFVDAKRKQLAQLQDLVDTLRDVSDKVSINKEEYISHPINQYHLIKRFANDWTQIAALLQTFNKTSFKFVQKFKKAKTLFPKDEDMKGGTEGILRVQITYNLNASDLVEGNIAGKYSFLNLSTDDCYRIGKTALRGGLFGRCVEWIELALQRFEEGKSTFTKRNATEYLDICEFAISKNETKYINHLDADPENTRILGNRIRFTRHARVQTQEVVDDKFYTFSVDETFFKLCRGEQTLTKKKQHKKLRCYLSTNMGNPKLLIRPVKVEELSKSPDIVQFHDVLSDTVINEIKKLAKPQLFRAIHAGSDDTDLQKAPYRITKLAWLLDDDGPEVAKITERISDITGLTLNTSEEIQVANYGVGGEYPPHFDIPTTDEERDDLKSQDGERIATFLIYLSDVEVGGRTAFVNAGVSAKPIKGSAVFWYNVFPSGEPDLRTYHGACPVAFGNKWAGNKWIREAGEMFRRKCELDRYADSKICYNKI
uniref:prolyl 4-hydroxylase subunit alpha-1-like n=1 Tax=Ciona intestinalis TaxID=7719 RepID=UPI000EF4E2FD|nr:prolyl 4-hydroxylase subunit alpha-1-like [Ciona intestinalis]|eukprot:XP_026690744.1 prolyl 4-hydroxylase subunit alpha-1-like [Ciona intestinalis]